MIYLSVYQRFPNIRWIDINHLAESDMQNAYIEKMNFKDAILSIFLCKETGQVQKLLGTSKHNVHSRIKNKNVSIP